MRWKLPVCLLLGIFLLGELGEQKAYAQKGYDLLPPPRVNPLPETEGTTPISLTDLVTIGLQNNPKLVQAGFEVDAARGKTVQAGLYPNPTLDGTFDELWDLQGRGGINTFPYLTQEIVTARKLQLQRAMAQQDVDTALFDLNSQRYTLLITVRKGYYKMLASQQRVDVLEQLKELADQAYKNAEKLREAKQIAELDVLGFRIEYNRLTARLEAAQRELVANWRDLVASIGSPNLPLRRVDGSLENPLPSYDYLMARGRMLELHPLIQAAVAQLAKAEVTYRRASVEKIPNITVGAGYVRQNQNGSDDVSFNVSIPLPLYNRNQGNVQAARAMIGKSQQEIRRVENELVQKLATSFGQYAAAIRRLERYRGGILQDAIKSYRLALQGFRGGQFEYLRVLTAQKFTAEANLEYIDALQQAWEAASEISGLLLEEQWPALPPGKQ